jgi:hypothetical protein
MASTAGRGTEAPRTGMWRREPSERAASMAPKTCPTSNHRRAASRQCLLRRGRVVAVTAGYRDRCAATALLLAVYSDAAFEADRVLNAAVFFSSPVSRDPGGGRMVGRGCRMRVLAALAVSSDGRCDSLPMRPARGSVTRTAAEALGGVARGDAAALNGRRTKPPGREVHGGAPCCDGTPEAVASQHGHDLLPAGLPSPRPPAGSSGGTGQ